MRTVLRSKFLENRGVTDVRLYDMLLIKARMNHEEIMKLWMQNYNILQLINATETFHHATETQERANAHKSTDFMDNFYESSD